MASAENQRSDRARRGEIWASQLHALRAAFEASPGHAIFTNVWSLSQSHQVLQRNQVDLLNHLDLPTHDPNLTIELFQNTRSTEIADDYFVEFTRFLHNYVAAVGSLVDHTRRLARKQSDPVFSSSYETRKSYVIDQPVAGFVQDLRNYVVHYAQLPINGSVRPGKSPALIMNVDVTAMRKWGGWNRKASSYMKRHGPAFDIRNPIVEYNELIESLYDWFYEEYEQVHAAALADLERKRLAYNHHMMVGP